MLTPFSFVSQAERSETRPRFAVGATMWPEARRGTHDMVFAVSATFHGRPYPFSQTTMPIIHETAAPVELICLCPKGFAPIPPVPAPAIP